MSWTEFSEYAKKRTIECANYGEGRTMHWNDYYAFQDWRKGGLMKWKEWIKAASVRALKTTCQTAIAAVPTTAVCVGDVEWVVVGSAAILAGILSLLTSLAGLPEIEGNGD